MSQQYDEYLLEHKANVTKGFRWIQANLPEILEQRVDYEQQIVFGHDQSKIMQDEYGAYDAYFYGKNRSYSVVQDFRYAWLNHIHRNPHHWQHWVLINDDPEEGAVILDMPNEYIIEMICDWWAFGWKDGNLWLIFEWYNMHKHYIKLSDGTQQTVERLLDQIRTKLEGEKTLEHGDCTNYDPQYCDIPYFYEQLANQGGRSLECLPKCKECNMYIKK